MRAKMYEKTLSPSSSLLRKGNVLPKDFSIKLNSFDVEESTPIDLENQFDEYDG